MTAAHCVYHYDKKAKKFITPSKILFYPNFPMEEKPVEVESFRVHTEYMSNDENYDFGILKLEENVGLKNGWVSLVVSEDKDLDLKIVNVTGYPLRKGFGPQVSKDMFTMEGPVTSVKKHKIHYRIDTSGGQSGAGFWQLDENKIVECYGVHVTGSKEEGNGAIRMNSENFNVIKGWLEKDELLEKEKLPKDTLKTKTVKDELNVNDNLNVKDDSGNKNNNLNTKADLNTDVAA